MGIDNLKDSVYSVNEIKNNNLDLINESKINEYDVPEELADIKDRITNLLNFRNENKDLNPNCNELMDVLIDLNNSLAREIKSNSPDLEACEKIKKSFNVLYDNVINHALVDISKFADKDSNLYKLFETLKSKLDDPKRVNLETREYLKVLSGVNVFQRERIINGEVVYPNEYENGVINESPEYDIPEELIDICNNLRKDIRNPEKLREDVVK